MKTTTITINKIELETKDDITLENIIIDMLHHGEKMSTILAECEDMGYLEYTCKGGTFLPDEQEDYVKQYTSDYLHNEGNLDWWLNLCDGENFDQDEYDKSYQEVCRIILNDALESWEDNDDRN